MLRWTVSLLAVMACEDPPRLRPRPDASAATSSSSSPVATRSGCVRSGVLDGIDSDPTCVVKQASEDANRSILKHLAISASSETIDVVAGSSGTVSITIRNTSTTETTVFFEARHRLGGPRTDWTRVAGVPDIHPVASETPRLLFPVTTTDLHDREIDALPTVANSNAPASAPVLLAVHLRPGAKVTHNLMWWALRIPAPAPIVTDDAGHRYVPKTVAMPLYPGDYNVAIDLPLYGLSREERKTTVRMHVVRPPLLDGGVRPPF